METKRKVKKTLPAASGRMIKDGMRKEMGEKKETPSSQNTRRYMSYLSFQNRPCDDHVAQMAVGNSPSCVLSGVELGSSLRQEIDHHQMDVCIRCTYRA